jgi:hypothetical protein
MRLARVATDFLAEAVTAAKVGFALGCSHPTALAAILKAAVLSGHPRDRLC